jgi:hypothetical protein
LVFIQIKIAKKWRDVLKNKKLPDILRDRLRFCITFQANTRLRNDQDSALKILKHFILINLGRDLLIEKGRELIKHVSKIQNRARDLISIKYSKVEILLI